MVVSDQMLFGFELVLELFGDDHVLGLFGEKLLFCGS